jgi:hypothetical protein
MYYSTEPEELQKVPPSLFGSFPASKSEAASATVPHSTSTVNGAEEPELELFLLILMLNSLPSSVNQPENESFCH